LKGFGPTGTAVPALPVARLTGVTVLSRMFATYSVEPSGVIAMFSGPSPTATFAPAVPVARSTGWTASSE
jgi:hypothetical protein